MIRAAPLLVLAAPLAAQEVAPCDPVPPVTALLEPWEETTASLAGGAVRLAVVDAGLGAVALVVLTLPPPDPEAGEGAPPPTRTCRVVEDAGAGFASLDLGAVAAAEDAEAATLVAVVPALRFLPESSELEEAALTLTFGVRDDALAAAVEGAGPAEPEDGATTDGP